MNGSERAHATRAALLKTRSVRPFDAVSGFLGARSTGDRVIFYILCGVVAVLSVVSLFALEQSLLVKVPAYGGTLTEGELGSPRFINPLLAISDADRDLTTLTYAGLLGLQGDGSLAPVLASDWSVSSDGKVYTVHLRKDATFSNGLPVTADDILFTVQKAQDPALKSPVYADWTGVSVQAVDAHTIVFTLTKPYAPFVNNLTLGILPKQLWNTVSDEEFLFSNLNTNPVGAGPFRVTDVSRDASGLITSLSLTENARYTLGRPYLDGMHFVFFAQSIDLTNALQKGAIQSAYGVPQDSALTAAYSRVFGVFFNANSNQLFARTEVRKALSLAIDRSALVQNALGSYGTALMGPVPPGSGIKETPVPVSANPTGDAAAILENAGWKYDGDARVWRNGTATLGSLTIKTSNVPELKAVATEVQTAWQKLGIETDIELYEEGDLNQNVIRPRKYDALLFGMVIGRDQDLYAFWDSQERNDPGLNIALYANKTVDNLLDDARQTGSQDARLADLQKINDDVSADYPAAFLYAPDFVYAVPQNLGGVTLPQITTPSDRFASVTHWYVSTDAVWPFIAHLNATK